MFQNNQLLMVYLNLAHQDNENNKHIFSYDNNFYVKIILISNNININLNFIFI